MEVAMAREDTQFKPGQSGNIRGRPKRQNCIPDLFRQVTSEPDKDDATKLETIVRQVVQDALKGNRWSIETIFDRLEGKPRQTVVQEEKRKDSIILDTDPDPDDDEEIVVLE